MVYGRDGGSGLLSDVELKMSLHSQIPCAVYDSGVNGFLCGISISDS